MDHELDWTPKLTVVSKQLVGEAFDVPPGRTIIGRKPGAAIRLTEASVSREHAALIRTGEQVMLVDLGSKNGTRVNGELIGAPHQLHDGDTVLVGSVELRFRNMTRELLGTDVPVNGFPGAAAPNVGAPHDAAAHLGSGTAEPSTIRQQTTETGPIAKPPVAVIRWWSTSRAIVLGMGGLAAAVLAVLSLWGTLAPPDQEDFAAITSVVVTRQMSLSEFAEGAPGTNVALRSARAIAPGIVDLAHAGHALPAGSVTLSEAATPTEVATPSDTTSPSDATSPSGIPNPSGTSTTTDSSTPMDNAVLRIDQWLPDPLVEAMFDHPAVEDYIPDIREVPFILQCGIVLLNASSSQCPDTAAGNLADSQRQGDDARDNFDEPANGTAAPENRTSPDVNGLDAAELANLIAEALSEVESIAKDGKKDPMGWVVAMNLEVRGLERVPLLLTWSLDGIDVPVSWAANRIAHRLIPTTDHDSGSPQVWVPDLERSGTYRVNVTLAREIDGSVLARGEAMVVNP
jgi:FHA domain